MPIFLYKCSNCKATVEKIQKKSEPPIYCDECGEVGTLEKQVSAPSSFILKGTGWYRTDFQNR